MKFVLLALGCAAVLGGASPSSQFRTGSNMVLINATVLDRQDRPVRGLTRDRFRVYDEKAEQRIAYFSEEETPLSLAILFDVSGSMDHKMSGMRAALDAILRDANAGDEFSLIAFADRPEVEVAWSPDADQIQSRLLEVPAHGQTSLLDAVAAGLAYMKRAGNSRKAMVILSDGGDNHSRFPEGEVLRSLAEAGVQIYAVDTTDPLILRGSSPEEAAGPDLLERLCEHAGGRYFQASGKRELKAAAEQISRELRSQYLIEYVPPAGASDGRFHHVRLQLEKSEGAPKVSLFWRRGYRSPGE